MRTRARRVRALRPRRLRSVKTAGSVGVGAENVRD
jgi:hypothetical protein